MSLSIQSSNLTGASVLGLQNMSVATSSANTAVKEEETESNAAAVSADGDTLEISAEGTAFAQKTFVASSKSTVTSEDEGYTDATAQMISEAASAAGISGSEDGSVTASSSSDSTTDLSSYTEVELKEMLQNGEITKAEYDAELESRQTDTAQTEETDETDLTAQE